MKKTLGILLLLVLALGLAPMLSSADTCAGAESGVGQACATDGGAVVLDGADGNEQPLDGFIIINGGGSDGTICASDDGDYTDDPREGCDIVF